MNNQVTKNVLVTGANGQLGSEFQYLSDNGLTRRSGTARHADQNFIFTTRKDLDIQNTQQVADFCQQNKIDVVINCAAYTAVDKAESEPEQADAINHLAVKWQKTKISR